MKELYIDRGGLKLYGRLYLPEQKTSPKMPLVILSHGYGSNGRNLEDYAEAFAGKGIPALAFDFSGGGSMSKSDGRTTEMSVLTEARDLEAVLDFFRENEDIDNRYIFLFGASQGGFVSTYVAGKRAEDVCGLILLYPAYVLQDDSRRRNPDPENGPAETRFMGTTIGRAYDLDAQSFNIYDLMPDYAGKVLIIHGTADVVVPISYSRRAAQTFPDAKLIEIEGAGHGFFGNDRKRASNLAMGFISGILKGGGAADEVKDDYGNTDS